MKNASNIYVRVSTAVGLGRGEVNRDKIIGSLSACDMWAWYSLDPRILSLELDTQPLRWRALTPGADRGVAVRAHRRPWVFCSRESVSKACELTTRSNRPIEMSGPATRSSEFSGHRAQAVSSAGPAPRSMLTAASYRGPVSNLRIRRISRIGAGGGACGPCNSASAPPRLALRRGGALRRHGLDAWRYSKVRKKPARATWTFFRSLPYALATPTPVTTFKPRLDTGGGAV